MTWQTIETAPKDEDVEFLGWDVANGFYVASFYYMFEGGVPKWARHDWSRCNPTHWQPLPEAPQ